ncbi:hypothetical protein ACWOE3_10215 [Enterococcus dispar]|uniref:Uncharacterized protein n=1 Tax=Enterococcus dispar ATCC 51266 TaxID=1139219 RepID=S1N6X3_9ENTE|nr:hypothetical protein [Enterococcus dispar]EOT42759.1 hypothetical protein OMK_01120 [Enterococcus dispar ATCC 51266]EOW84790.1 hypothetical protein I569_00079 [Enterococcus dispar ATCC 51266]OJG38462.1 hypothetical protein RV01_GL002517 [Enterococcus dispar]
MKLKDVPEAVGLSRITIYNYRKSLGILEETSEEVSDKLVEKFKKMAAAKVKSNNGGKKKTDVIKKAREINDSTGFIDILDGDSAQLKNLKSQYNSNQVLINHLTKAINKDILSGETPTKLETDMMEKYQKLNMSLAKTIELNNPAGDSLAAAIKEKLSQYGGVQ